MKIIEMIKERLGLDEQDLDKEMNGQVKSPAKITETKKSIARLKTLIEEKNA